MVVLFMFFFFNDTATTEIYTLSLHDALPISSAQVRRAAVAALGQPGGARAAELARATYQTDPSYEVRAAALTARSEEHTSELQSLAYLVCRLLLEKKKKII